MRKRTRGIIIPPETRTGVKRLSQEQKGCLLDAIYSYNIDGEIIEMDTSVGIVFDMMKDFFDINIENYDKISEQNAEKMRNRWGKIQNDTTVYNGIQQNTTEYKSIQDYTTATNKEKKRKENINKEKEIKTDTEIIANESNEYQKSIQYIKTFGINSEIPEYAENYRDEWVKFCIWWSEKSRTGKIKAELEKTFEIKKRFATWMSRKKDQYQQKSKNSITTF